MRRNPTETPFKARAGFLALQFGLGAAGTMLAWRWLMYPDGAPREGSVLLPLLFGFALPGLVSWIPLTVAIPFFSSAAIRRAALFFAAGALIVLAVSGWIGADNAVLSAGTAVALHLVAIQFAALENGRNPGLFEQQSTAVLGGWIGGVAVAGAISSATHQVGGYAFAALALASGGILTADLDRSSRSPWLLAERSIGRFARLADLMGTEPKARQPLLLFCALFGLAMTSLAWLPACWQALPGENGEREFQLGHLSIATGCFLLGLGCGSLRTLSHEGKKFRPGRVLSVSVAGSLGALSLLSWDPVRLAPLCFFPGFALGFAGRLCRESLLDALDRKGARLPRETEAAVCACLCLSLLVVGGLLAILEKTNASQWPAMLLLAGGWGALTFFSWRIAGGAPSQKGEIDTGSWIPDTWAPGFAPKPDRVPAGDGRAVTIRYDVPRENLEEFHEAIAVVGRIRRREGGLQWRLASDLERPGRLTESYVLESWCDYQETLRHESSSDRAAKQRVFDLNDWNSLPREDHEMLEEV